MSHPLNTRRLRGYVLTALRAYAAPISPLGLNTPTRLRLLPYGQYAYAAALCRIRSIRAACAAMCSLRCAHTPRLSATPIQSKRRACVPIEARSQTFLAPREHVPANRYIHQYADANHHAQNARTAIRNERQSNPDDGCPTHDHGRIDDDLPKEYGCYPHC